MSLQPWFLSRHLWLNSVFQLKPSSTGLDGRWLPHATTIHFKGCSDHKQIYSKQWKFNNVTSNPLVHFYVGFLYAHTRRKDICGRVQKTNETMIVHHTQALNSEMSRCHKSHKLRFQQCENPPNKRFLTVLSLNYDRIGVYHKLLRE